VKTTVMDKINKTTGVIVTPVDTSAVAAGDVPLLPVPRSRGFIAQEPLRGPGRGARVSIPERAFEVDDPSAGTTDQREAHANSRSHAR